MANFSSSSTSPHPSSSRLSFSTGNSRLSGAAKLSSSLNASSSQINTSSGSSNYTFKPHILLSDASKNPDLHHGRKNMLDYSELNERIEIFKELINIHLDQSTIEMERKRDDHKRTLQDERNHVNAVKDGVERQKEEQKALYQTVASERQAESSAQSQLALLQASRTSLAQRLAEAESERDSLQATLERKKHSFEQRKNRLTQQVRRNRPELIRFNEKLGCRVSAGHHDPSSTSTMTEFGRSSNRSIIKFTFNLIDPDDWSYEANFVIDASRSQYKIISAKPALPPDELETLLADLNRSRALFTFIKRIRSAFKQQVERQKQASKSTQK